MTPSPCFPSSMLPLTVCLQAFRRFLVRPQLLTRV
jgi:hypothetical protein